MATFLDVGILEYFLPLFIFIFIFILLYSILQKTKILGGNQVLDLLTGIIITLVSFLSGSTFDFVNLIIPPFVMLSVAIILIIFTTSSFLKKGILDLPYLRVLILVSSCIIILWAVISIFGPVFNPYIPNANPWLETLRTIFHPRILGAILILLVVSSTIKLIVNSK